MTCHYPDDDAVARVGLGLVARDLPCADWTHAAHFAAALWLLRHRPEPPAEAAMPQLIRAYNLACGKANTDSAGYHETITLASLRAARSVLAAHPPDRPLHEVLDALMQSRLGRPDWLLAHWTRERLFSVEARRAWIPPDLAPLPF